MQKFNSLAVVLAFCVILGFSLVAFAATKKGPCGGGGHENYKSDTVSSDGQFRTVEEGLVYLDQSCAGLNENDCVHTYVPQATRKDGTIQKYKRPAASFGQPASTWEKDGDPVPVFEQGKYVC